MPKHLVLAGAGHAHLTILSQIADLTNAGHRVTVVSPSVFHYYSGMGPGMLGGTYSPQAIRFPVRQMTETSGGVFVEDSISRIDPDRKILHLASGDHLSYDVLSVNIGSYVPDTLIVGSREDVFPVKPIDRLMAARERILSLPAAAGNKQPVVAVVGGGPAAAEIAGNVWHLANATGCSLPEIYLFTGTGLMTRFPAGVRQRAGKILTKHGVHIDETGFVRGVHTGGVTLASGETRPADVIIMAPGVRPSPVFGDSGLPVGPDGGLRVNAYLQCTAYPDILGGGDCIYFEPSPLDKVGVYAVRQNPILYHNIKAALAGNGLRPFDPGGDYMLILNLGGGIGVLKKRWVTFSGKPAFRIKDYIDRRFMARFPG
ncbi:MAG: FAD-dependent oxidoreductase [Thermodesulfobacteriota bacterium]|nr:FAD-dependent oxidoreductase [Thermodesulfobacteriota bacterium]